MNATTAAARPAALPGGRANTLLWAAQIVLAAFFAFAAVPKLAGAHTAVTMFGQIGAGQWLARPQASRQNDQDRRPS